MEIRQYRPEDHDALTAICLATASEKARTDPRHGRFTLLFYCEPYLAHEHALVLIEDNQPQGYILFAENYEAYRKNMRPYLEEIRKLGGYEERCAGEMDFCERYAETYPAHMHIDILEAHTSRGYGTALVSEALKIMKADGVKGVMLGVAKKNERAFRFYRKLGFEILEEDEGGYGMGLKLQEEDRTVNAQTERIMHMEACLDRCTAASEKMKAALNELESVSGDLEELRRYYESGQWRQDYEDDEKGLLPDDLKRGVLSQDAVYDLLDDMKQTADRMKEWPQL